MIYNKYFETDNKISNIFSKIKEMFSLKNIVFIILSFLLSSKIFLGDYSQFSSVLLGVASVFNVPLLVVLIPTAIGLMFGTITKLGVIKLIAIFIIFTIFTSIIKIDGISKKYESLLKLLVSIGISEIVINFINSTLSSNLFLIIQNLLVTSIFYMIFVAGVYVLINLGKNYIFSQEENIASISVILVTLGFFNMFTIYNISVINVIYFIIILIYGFKKGSVLGASAGLLGGVMLTLTNNISIVNVIMLAISGAVAGIFKRFGKISVIVAFIISNVYIIFYASGISDITMRISEMLIASLTLLLVPKKVEIKLESFFNKNATLSKPYENMLDSSAEVKEKINMVSSIFDDLSKIDVLKNDEEKIEFKKILKRYILDYIECSCINCDIKKECKKIDRINLIIDNVTLKLINGEKLTDNLFNDIDCKKSKELISGIEEVYSNIRVMKILKEKELENNIKITKQYREVSNILRSISKNLKSSLVVKDQNQSKIREELKLNGFIVYEDEYILKDGKLEYTFVTDILTNIDKQKKLILSSIEQIVQKKLAIKLILNSSKTEKSKIKVVTIPKYEVKNAISSQIKDGENISGDSYLSYELEDRKYAVILSDGASSGNEANKFSHLVISTLEKLFKSGFDVNKSFEILNSIMKLRNDTQFFATVDISIFDLDTLDLNIIKFGAAPTYIVESFGKVTTITSNNMPVGLNEKGEFFPINQKLKEGSIVVQLTDGVISDRDDVNNNFITDYLKNIDFKKNPKVILDDLNKLLMKNNKNILEDDATISVTKILKNM